MNTIVFMGTSKPVRLVDTNGNREDPLVIVV